MMRSIDSIDTKSVYLITLSISLLAVGFTVPYKIFASSNSDNDDAPLAGESSCEASYPDVCIASPPPNLNCDDIDDNNFKVLPPDPHGFDSEGDGIGCEA